MLRLIVTWAIAIIIIRYALVWAIYEMMIASGEIPTYRRLQDPENRFEHAYHGDRGRRSRHKSTTDKVAEIKAAIRRNKKP